MHCQLLEEKGEKSTRFFFGLEKFNFSKKHIRKLELQDGKVVTNSKEILKEGVNFYENLYKSTNVQNNYLNSFLSENVSTLNEDQKQFCDKEITIEECFKTLNTFHNNKSPGNDGITKEFYCKFWKEISPSLIDSYQYSYENESLSASQRQAVITLLEKRDKDKSFLCNWRPISPLNFDYKLLTKVFANRIKEVLPSIISSTQTGYVKNRSIEDSVRIIQDVINYLFINNLPGILVTVDFQKAFDTIEWPFIIETLKKFNFGNSFIKWVQLFYTNISSCIINNGTTSRYFKINRGVRQGDPLSPYLFIIATEVLANAIKRNPAITGINIKNKEVEMTQYADDLTLTLRNSSSIDHLLTLLNNFSKCSGLKINKHKTEAMCLGSMINNNTPSNMKFTKGPIKLLGIYISSNPTEIVSENFQSKIDSLIRQLHWWKARNLSLQGRVLVSKSLGLSKFQYLASLFTFPDHIIKQINTIIYEFIWRGKCDKVKRKIFEQSPDKGGFKMLNAIDLIKAASIMWIKKYFDDVERSWKHTFEYFCKHKNLNLYLRSNFSKSELPLTIPKYYQDSILNWSSVSCQTASNDQCKSNSYIWYNRHITVGGKTLYNNNLFSIGLWVINDLFENNRIIPFNVWKVRGATELDRLTYSAIISIIQKLEIIDDLTTTPCGIINEGKVIAIQKVNQKHIKTWLANEKYSLLNDSDKIYKKFSNLIGPVTDEEWNHVFNTVQETWVDNKTKELQYKILMRFFPTNSLLYKMKKIQSPSCTFCGFQLESIEHLFFHCVYVNNLWSYVLNEWSRICGYHIPVTFKTCILGSFGNTCMSSNERVCLSTALLIVKSFIAICRFDSVEPCIPFLVNFLTCKVELFKMAYECEGLNILDEIINQFEL